jgi:hypothetical protein
VVVEHRDGFRLYKKKVCRAPGKKGAYKRTRRKKAPLRTKESFESALAALAKKFDGDLEEFFESVTVLLTRAQCFNGPEAPLWLEADTKERLVLEVAKCWRPITCEDLKDIQEIVLAASCTLRNVMALIRPDFLRSAIFRRRGWQVRSTHRPLVT